MARKAKKKLHAMPKLSVVDRLIYWSIFAVLCVLWISLGFLPFVMDNRIAFADEMVTAYNEHVSQLWMMVPWMTFFLMTFLLWHIPYEARKPIFGRKNFKYGPPAWPRVYPLFMKDKPKYWISPKQQKNKRDLAIFLVILLLLSFIPLPWSFYGRDCLHTDGTIHRYNMFNVQTREYDTSEIASVRFTAYFDSSGHRTSHRMVWEMGVELITENGQRFFYDTRDFRKDNDAEILSWLPTMLQLKAQFDPAIVSCTGTQNLGNVMERFQMNPQEKDLLRQLFGLA